LNDIYLVFGKKHSIFSTSRSRRSVLPIMNHFKKKVTNKDLPKFVDQYRKLLQKYFVIHNRKLLRELEKPYDMLHIAGYYRGLLYDLNVVKKVLKAPKSFIDKIR
jgi:hypothetical protein